MKKVIKGGFKEKNRQFIQQTEYGNRKLCLNFHKIGGKNNKQQLQRIRSNEILGEFVTQPNQTTTRKNIKESQSEF